MADQTPKPASSSIFSSLSLGRRSKPSAPPPESTLAHPLLGASSSSVNLAPTDFGPEISASQSGPSTHSRQTSWTAATTSPPTATRSDLPYKPRQRHGGGIGSTSSANSIIVPITGSPSLVAAPLTSTSPVTPTSVMAAPPTTSTSTSTTVTLPPAASPADVTNSTDTSASQSTLVLPASSGTATARLQLQSLKAAAQGIGLGNGSMGMAMIDAVFEKGSLGKGKLAEGGDWAEVLKVLMSGKAVMLLPTAAASSLPMTAQIIRDHIAFIGPPVPLEVTEDTDRPSTVSVVVTLSGLVGTLKESTITFESILPADSPLLFSLRDCSRPSTLSTLRPTHIVPSSAHPPYPGISLSIESAALQFPPLIKGGAADANNMARSPPSGKLGRMNPFASFFGSGTAPSPSLGSSPGKTTNLTSPTKTGDGVRTPDIPTSPIPSSPRPSLLAPDPIQNDTASVHSVTSDKPDEGYQVSAYVVSKPVRLPDAQKAIIKATRACIREELARLPDKVIDKVCKLVCSGIVPEAESKSDKDGVNVDFADPTAAGEKVQEFMEGVYDDLILHHRADSSYLFADGTGNSGLIRRTSGSMGRKKPVDDDEKGGEERVRERRAAREEVVEREASEGTERVEAVVCRLLYNRIFSPPEADDAGHDEALASRIAALNMLDLSLDHLGLVTRPEDEEAPGTIAEGLSALVALIGSELQKLATPDCLTPKEKADVLIAAHKVVVDGLAELPAIGLRPEGEPYKPTSRPVSRTSSRPASPDPTHPSSVPSSRPVSPPRKRSRDTTPPPALIPHGAQPDATPRPPPPPLLTKRTSSGSIPLSRVSSTDTDPLLQSGATQVSSDKAPKAPLTEPPVPSLVLTDPTESSARPADIEQALSDSVHTLHADSGSSVPPPRPPAPSPSPAPSKSPQPSGADLILPLIIFSVVKSNPPQLASQLMYLRRYRSAICLTGEASYAIVNLTAVVEFLESVRMEDLGLEGGEGKVISIEDLSPIGLNYLDDSNADAASIASSASRLRGRVFQVGELAAGSANKVISGVMDSSWTAIRGLIASTSVPGQGSAEEKDKGDPSAATDASRPSMRARQASTFSLANVTASVANIAAAAAATTAAARTRSRAASRASVMESQPSSIDWTGNQELADIAASRPESILEKNEYPSPSDSEEEPEDDDNAVEEAEQAAMRRERARSDARSIKSVSSVMSASKREREREKEGDRASLSERLANIGLAKQGDPSGHTSKPASALLPSTTASRNTPNSVQGGENAHHRRSSLLGGIGDPASRLKEMFGSPATASSGSLPLPASLETHVAEPLDPPIERFMTCEVGDIRLSEVGALLRDYRRLGHLVNSLGSRSPQQP